MKHFVACTALALCLALPTVSFARDHRDDRDGRDGRGGYGYRDDHGYRGDQGRYDRGGHYDDHRHWHGGPVRFVGQVIAFPFVVGAALIGATVEAVASPFNGHYYDQPQRAAYGPPPDEGYYDRDDRGQYYNNAPPGRVYGPPPQAYYPPQPEYRGY